MASTNGVSIALHHLGGEHGDTPTLLVCHATGFHGRCYRRLAESLVDSFSVWALDFRAHGASGAPADGNMAWSGMGDDVLACIDELGGGPLAAFGHSMGGGSIMLAQKLRPGVISRAFLFEPIAFPKGLVEGSNGNFMADAARRRRAVFESRFAALERYSAKPPLGSLDPGALADYVEFGFIDTDDGQVTLACEPEHEARVFESEDKMTFDAFDGLALNAVVAIGTPEYESSPASWGPGIADALDGGRLAVYESVGHLGPMQDPDLIAAEVKAALL